MTDYRFTKDPSATLDFSFDWSDWLAAGETIESYTLTAESGITLVSDSADDEVVTLYLSGGTNLVEYTISCEIHTSADRTDTRVMIIAVQSNIDVATVYATLQEFKEYLLRRRSYVASTISFTQTGSIIADTYKRLGRFVGASLIQVSGSVAANNGIWEVSSISNSQIVVSGTLTNAAIGSEVTLTDVSRSEDNDLAEQMIEAASRAVDTHCHQRFWDNAADEARIYTSPYPDLFFSPIGIVSITELATDEDGDGIFERVWAASDFVLQPATGPLDGKPYNKIRVAERGRYTFPRTINGTRLTGVFGWASVPALVKSATLLQASRWYERRNSPFGVIAVTDMAVVTVKNDLDPDVQVQLAGLVRVIV